MSVFYNSLMTTLMTCCFPLSPASQIVVTPSGSVRGFEMTSRDGRAYQAWTSIPFALPPVGRLRLKAPRPVPTWNGVLNATHDMPTCLQKRLNITKGTEDCLYLSVYKPKVSQATMPVIFYLHGGAFSFGGVGPRNSPDYIMDENVVLVLANYRLNGFGFMTLGDTTLPGNFGLKDQVLALRWVRRNIASFGGDPNSVTVFGISAGAVASHFLLNSPASSDLVTRAVSISGTINHVWSLLKTEQVKNYTLRVANEVDCFRETTKKILKCLQQVDANVLLNAITSLPPLDFAHFFFAPVIEPSGAENAVVTEDLSLRPSNKPWITSLNNGEYLEFLLFELLSSQQEIESVRDDLQGYLEGVVRNHTTDPVKIREGSQLLESTYFPQREPLDTFRRELAKLEANQSFVFPAVFNIRQHRGPKWIAHFEYKAELAIVVDPSTRRPFADNVASHAVQVVLYLNYRSEHPNAGPNETDSDRQVSKRLIKRLVNFAYHGNPTPPGSSVQWSQFSTNQILRVTADGDFLGSETFFQQFQDEYELWYNIEGWGDRKLKMSCG